MRRWRIFSYRSALQVHYGSITPRYLYLKRHYCLLTQQWRCKTCYQSKVLNSEDPVVRNYQDTTLCRLTVALSQAWRIIHITTEKQASLSIEMSQNQEFLPLATPFDGSHEDSAHIVFPGATPSQSTVETWTVLFTVLEGRSALFEGINDAFLHMLHWTCSRLPYAQVRYIIQLKLQLLSSFYLISLSFMFKMVEERDVFTLRYQQDATATYGPHTGRYSVQGLSKRFRQAVFSFIWV